MSEIKRYNAKHFGDFEMVESPQGEWVRWEDVQQLLALKPIIIVPRGVSIHRMMKTPPILTEDDYNTSFDGPHGTGSRHGE